MFFFFLIISLRFINYIYLFNKLLILFLFYFYLCFYFINFYLVFISCLFKFSSFAFPSFCGWTIRLLILKLSSLKAKNFPLCTALTVFPIFWCIILLFLWHIICIFWIGSNTCSNVNAVKSKFPSVSHRIWQETKNFFNLDGIKRDILTRKYYRTVTRTRGSSKEC